MTSIFSTYSTGENRVTASFLAVLRSLSLDRMQRLIRALLEQAEFELIRFQNQQSKGGTGVPDAIIQSSIRLLVETKIVRDTVSLPQIKRHLERLDEATEATALLLVLTPDEARPMILEKLDDERVVWTSFSILDQAIDEMLEDKTEVASEREAFILRQFQKMLEEASLLKYPNDIVIVAARSAWPEYNHLHAYICQPNRSFQQVTRLGFYSKGEIHPLIPKIIASHDEVEMRRNTHQGELGKLVESLLDQGLRQEFGIFKVLMLSAPDSPETLKLDRPIPNNKLDKSGKGTAYTMSQRYSSSDRLRAAKTTLDLD